MRLTTNFLKASLAMSCLAIAACGGTNPVGSSSNGITGITGVSGAAGKAKIASTASPSGATIPSGTQIIDNNDAVWTVVNGVIYVNGQTAGYSGAVVLLLYYADVIYQANVHGGWWKWNGTDWIATSDPRSQATVSASGTTIPSATQIVDASVNVWTVSGGVISENGKPAGFSAGVTLLLYDNNVIYQENINADWWSWNGSTWVTSSDPRGVPVYGACGTTNGMAVTVAPSANLCSAGTASAMNGTGPWTWSCGGSYGGTTASCSASKAAPTISLPSPNLTTIPSATQIVDASANVWSVSGGVVNENGAPAGSSAGVALLLYDNNIVYQETSGGSWQSWNGSTWVSSSDPRIAVVPVNGACGTSNGVTATTTPTTNLCSIGTPSTASGTGPWTWSCSGISGGTTASCSAPKAALVSSGVASPNGTTVPSATQIVDSGLNSWTLVSGAVYENGKPASYSANAVLLLYYNGAIYTQNSGGFWWSWGNGSWAMSSDPRGASVPPSGGGSCSSSGASTLVADTNRPNNSTFVQGEPVTLTFKATGACASTVNLAIVDEHSNRVITTSVPMTNGAATYTAPSSKLGYYRVNASLADGAAPVMLGTRPAGFITYAVVPDPATRVNYGDALSRFGMVGGFDARQGSVIPYLGVRYVLGTPSWNALEPNNTGQLAAEVAQGQYPPTAPYIDAVTYNGVPWPTFEIGLIAQASTPKWAGPLAGTAGTGCAAFGALTSAGVAGLPQFAAAYGTATAHNFPNQSKRYYQVTWEPEVSWCYNGTGAQLTQYYQLVYAALHAADPAAQVMGPTLFYHGDEALLASMYAAGFGSLIDAFSMHPYAPWPFETSTFVADLRAEMAQVNAAAGKTVPFVGTEHGYVSGQIGELNQALGNVREEIMLIGEGFIHDYSFYITDFWVNGPTDLNWTYGFYWNLNPNLPQGTDKLGPKPAAPAFAAMTYLLDGTTTRGPISHLSGTQMGYRFQRNGTTILALWDYQAASSTVNLAVSAQSVQICDWMGNCNITSSGGSLNLTLGASPIYVLGNNL